MSLMRFGDLRTSSKQCMVRLETMDYKGTKEEWFGNWAYLDHIMLCAVNRV
jgi:hypothetical protein